MDRVEERFETKLLEDLDEEALPIESGSPQPVINKAVTAKAGIPRHEKIFIAKHSRTWFSPQEYLETLTLFSRM